jgi:hypothetical protein
MVSDRALPFADRAEVLLSDQANGVARPIDNEREQVQDIAAKHAHVEGFQIGKAGKLSLEYCLGGFVVSKADLRFNGNRINDASHPAQSSRAVDGLNTMCPFFGYVSGEAAVIIGMGRPRQGEGCFSSIGDEEFLARNTQALSSMPRIDVRRMRLEPGPISLEVPFDIEFLTGPGYAWTL